LLQPLHAVKHNIYRKEKSENYCNGGKIQKPLKTTNFLLNPIKKHLEKFHLKLQRNFFALMNVYEYLGPGGEKCECHEAQGQDHAEQVQPGSCETGTNRITQKRHDHDHTNSYSRIMQN
jgi:hypothetical protein